MSLAELQPKDDTTWTACEPSPEGRAGWGAWVYGCNPGASDVGGVVSDATLFAEKLESHTAVALHRCQSLN